MNIQIQHVLKFKLWVLSNNWSVLRGFIRFLGRLATKNINESWKKKLLINSHYDPNNEYVRNSDVPTQVLVLTSEKIQNTDYKGISLFLNHIRVPYRVNNIVSIKNIQNLSLVVFTDEEVFNNNRFINKWNESTAFIIFSSKITSKNTIIGKNMVFIKESSSGFLPYYYGLRSDFSSKIIKKIRKIVQIPLVTGMPSKSIGLRIDDVKGDDIRIYLNEILKHGWHPNLGIFLDDIDNSGKNVTRYLSKLDKENSINISPHAYSNEKFIFYNYPKGRAYSVKEFRNIWTDVLNKFDKFSFKISPVINAHFHVLSKSAALQNVRSGAKYFFSELEVDSHKTVPSKKYWPAGDPLHCTGKLNDCGVFQLSSGDNILDTLSSRSYYDFLMHSKNYNIDRIRKRIIYRLQMSLDCGFAAYITTHEYLINNIGKVDNKMLWSLVESDLEKELEYKVHKKSLFSIGREFETRRKSIINSIKLEDGLLKVEMIGSTNSDDNLTVFRNNKLENVVVSTYVDKLEVTINYEEKK